MLAFAIIVVNGCSGRTGTADLLFGMTFHAAGWPYVGRCLFRSPGGLGQFGSYLLELFVAASALTMIGIFVIFHGCIGIFTVLQWFFRCSDLIVAARCHAVLDLAGVVPFMMTSFAIIDKMSGVREINCRSLLYD